MGSEVRDKDEETVLREMKRFAWGHTVRGGKGCVDEAF